MDKSVETRVVFINQNAGYLAVDILNFLVLKYDKVVLIAGTVRPMERELSPGVKIQKIIKYNRGSALKRLFTLVWGSMQIFFLLLFKYNRYEVIYTTNPPMSYFSSFLMKQKFSVIVYDIYPDALKNIGIRESNFIYKWWSQYNRKLFKKAYRIITLSNGMAERLDFYVNREKIKVIPNWSGSDKFAPLQKKDNPFIKEHILGNKFIVLYSGNIGYTHNIETIIEVAKCLGQREDICFLIIGEGRKKDRLIKMVKDYCLNNCIFMTWQKSEVLQYSLASADLAVITINDDTAALSVPSKTYNLLAVGAPLLCIAPENSELSFLVSKYRNGVCYSKDSIKDIADYIINISKDKRLQEFLSHNSLDASKDFTCSNVKYYL